MNGRIAVFALLAVLTAGIAIGLRFRREAPSGSPEVTEAGDARAETSSPGDVAQDEPVSPKRTLRIPNRVDGAKADPNAPPYPLAAYADRKNAEIQKWRSKTICLDFEDTAIRDMLTYLLREYELQASLDASVGADKTLSFKVQDLAGDAVLKLLAQAMGLTWVISESGESWLVPKERASLYEPELQRELQGLAAVSREVEADRAPAAAPKPSATDNVLDSMRISLNFTETALADVVSFVQEVSSLNIMIDRGVMQDAAETAVTFTADDLSLREALTKLLEGAGAGFCIEDGVLVVRSKEALAQMRTDADHAVVQRAGRLAQEDGFFSRRVTLPAEDLYIRDVAELLSKATGVGFVIDAATWSRAAHYGFDGKERTIREIADILGKGAPVTLAYRDGKMWFLAAK